LKVFSIYLNGFDAVGVLIFYDMALVRFRRAVRVTAGPGLGSVINNAPIDMLRH
jgi:hypothetical protein